MRRAPSAATAAALLLALAATPAFAGSSIAVAITNPPPSEPAFGEMDLEAQVYAEEEVLTVEFYLDGELAGRDDQSPYRVRVDLGYDNQSHEIRVVAHGVTGAVGEETLTTVPLAVEQKLDLDLHQLYVTVKRGGSRALDLNRSDFTVYEDGVRQDLVTFERGEVPITAVLLLDSSESMRDGRLHNAIAGARAFVSGLEGLDQGMVVLFSDRLLRSTPFTDDPAALAAVTEGAMPEGGTALNDHLYLALKKLETRPGRPVVVVFSDGTDAHSVLPMEEVLWKTRRSQALVYWVLLEADHDTFGDTITTAWRDAEGNRREVDLLRKVVNDSGGEIYRISDPGNLEGAFRAILSELRDQYVLGYYSSSPHKDGSWRKVRVDVAGLGLRARHRGGYVDD